jgi:hypothetical protein
MAKLDMQESAAPGTPASGYTRIYFDLVGRMHTITDLGVDVMLGAEYLVGLSDVVLTGPGAGQVLTYNGVKWVNQTPGAPPVGTDNQHGTFCGRLTLTTGVPVTTADVTAAATLYLTPFNGIQLWTYDAGVWTKHTLAEISLNLAGCVARTQAYTNDPAAGSNIELNMAATAGFLVGDVVTVSSSAGTETARITVVHVDTHITVNVLALNHTTVSPLVTGALPYDIWVYNNAGTLTLEALAWTDGVTRATALALQDSVYVKSGDATRRYVGTIYTDAAGAACTDSLIRRGVWNYYNRVTRPSFVATATNRTLTTNPAAWAQVHADWTVRFIVGVVDQLVRIRARILVKRGTGSGDWGMAIGLNSTSAVTGQTFATSDAAVTVEQMALEAYVAAPLGFSYCTLLGRTNTVTDVITVQAAYVAGLGPNTTLCAEVMG